MEGRARELLISMEGTATGTGTGAGTRGGLLMLEGIEPTVVVPVGSLPSSSGAIAVAVVVAAAAVVAVDSKRRSLLLLAASISTAVSCDGVVERRAALSADAIVTALLGSFTLWPSVVVVYALLVCTASSDGSASKMGSST